MADGLTHHELVERAGKWLRGSQRCRAVIIEPTGGIGIEQPDAIGWRGGMFSVLVECKASRGDFLKDKLKLFRQYPTIGLGAERWFMTNKRVACPSELPEHWGLCEVAGNTVRIIHPAKENAFLERPMHHEVRLLVSAFQRQQDLFNEFLQCYGEDEEFKEWSARSER